MTHDRYSDMTHDPEERLQIVISKLEDDDLLMLNYELDEFNNLKLFLGGPFDH